METQLPVAMLQHLESIGCLPKSHGDDGVDDFDKPQPKVYEFRTPEFDENGDPEF